MLADTLRLLSGILLTAEADPELSTLPKFYMESETGDSGHASGGHAWYQRQFSLLQYDPEDTGKIKTDFGMGGSWMTPYGIDFPGNPCELKPVPHIRNYETFEGGSSYSESVFGRQPKWKLGDSVGCYRSYTNSNLFHTHRSVPHACSWEDSSEPKFSMGFAQLSNRLLIFPDGMAFEKEGMIGLSFGRTPFGKLNGTDDRNFWTLIFDSENYAGPVGYFVPEFWALRPEGEEEKAKDYGDFSNSPEISMHQPAWECHGMACHVDGNVTKLLHMAVPQVKNRTVLWMGQRAHEDSELFDPLEEALASGDLDSTKLLFNGTTRPSCLGQSQPAHFGDVAAWATHNNVIEDGDCLWTLKVANESCPADGICSVPQYYEEGKPVDPSRASEALRKTSNPTEPIPTDFAYDALTNVPAGGCRDSPGPADAKLYCTKTIDDTWVGYRWYRFVDQPGLQQQKLTETEKAFMQQRAESLHKNMAPTPVSKWINGRNVEAEGLARMEVAAIATPPSGLEAGYVPIVLFQGFARPSECNDVPEPFLV